MLAFTTLAPVQVEPSVQVATLTVEVAVEMQVAPFVQGSMFEVAALRAVQLVPSPVQPSTSETAEARASQSVPASIQPAASPEEMLALAAALLVQAALVVQFSASASDREATKQSASVVQSVQLMLPAVELQSAPLAQSSERPFASACEAQVASTQSTVEVAVAVATQEFAAVPTSQLPASVPAPAREVQVSARSALPPTPHTIRDEAVEVATPMSELPAAAPAPERQSEFGS
jgi:hypothetical protein